MGGGIRLELARPKSEIEHHPASGVAPQESQRLQVLPVYLQV